MNSVILYRNQVRDTIKDALPLVRTVKTTAGKVTPADIKNLSTDAPAILVCAIGITETKADSRGMIWGKLKLGVLCIVRDLGPKLPAEVAAWELAISVTKLAGMNRFAFEPVSPVTGFDVDNMMNDDTISDGLGVIGLSWDVFIELGTDFGAAEAAVGGWTNAMFPEDVALTVVEEHPEP
ncbi:hypothetical protein ACJ4V0_15600 [Phreatobacter sp. HK31-P]